MKKTSNPLIFVVEDNQIYNKLVVSYLKTNHFTNVESFTSGEEVLQNLDKKPAIIIQDYLLDGLNGIDVLKKAKKVIPECDFIFLSGQDSIDIAINTMKYGAYDYVVKDQASLQKIVNKIGKIMSHQDLVVSNNRYKSGVRNLFVAVGLIVAVSVTAYFIFPQWFN